MGIKAIAFDAGETLIFYNEALNWQDLYSPAIRQVMTACNMAYTTDADEVAQRILSKYNTRVNFREHEVSSDTIFSEILKSWQTGIENLQTAKRAFYGYFQKGAKLYEDTESTLQSLKSRGLKIGVLTDVAYGMDNEYALADLKPIEKYIDICLTSNDMGYRKPNTKGYFALQKFFNIPHGQIAFVGNEEKDIAGANNAGFISVLINRDDEKKCLGQRFTICKLSEILGCVDTP